MSDEKMSSALGIRALSDIDEGEKQLPAKAAPEEVANTEVAVIDPNDDENLKDIESVRTNIEEIMETGAEAMKEMLEIAKQSEQPRAFEVVSTLMKTMLDANKDFADISSKRKFVKEEINGPKDAANQQSSNVVNNNLILSTSDLLKMLKDSANDPNEGVIDG
jgi:hypothetical protein|tara:strand:+ start:68 stop:556 length:489 start_codon:yes stop_codon:yes gene_type:complete